MPSSLLQHVFRHRFLDFVDSRCPTGPCSLLPGIYFLILGISDAQLASAARLQASIFLNLGIPDARKSFPLHRKQIRLSDCQTSGSSRIGVFCPLSRYRIGERFYTAPFACLPCTRRDTCPDIDGCLFFDMTANEKQVTIFYRELYNFSSK